MRAGRTESAVMPLADTLAVQRIMNNACEQLGVFHAEDAGRRGLSTSDRRSVDSGTGRWSSDDRGCGRATAAALGDRQVMAYELESVDHPQSDAASRRPYAPGPG